MTVTIQTRWGSFTGEILDEVPEEYTRILGEDSVAFREHTDVEGEFQPVHYIRHGDIRAITPHQEFE